MHSSSTLLAVAALGSAASALQIHVGRQIAANDTIVTTTFEITTTLTTTPTSTVTLPPISEVTVCPQPTGIAQSDVPEPNMQYGCSPGFVCDQPKPDECNVWPGLPSQDFVCNPANCVQAPPLPERERPVGEIGYVAPVYGYFDLNPEIFGLSYDIFAYHLEEQVINGLTVTVSTGNWEPTSQQAAPTGVVRRQLRQTFPLNKKRQSVPNPAPQCYDVCNDSAHVAQQFGLRPELCSETTWLGTYQQCVNCILAAGSPRDTIRVYVEPQFERPLSYCFGDFVTNPSNATSTATVPDQITQSLPLTTETQESAQSTGFVTSDITSEVTTTEISTTSVSISSSASTVESSVSTITTVVTETSVVTETPGTVTTTSFSTSLPPFPTPIPTPTPGEPAAAVRVTASGTFPAILLGIVAMLV